MLARCHSWNFPIYFCWILNGVYLDSTLVTREDAPHLATVSAFPRSSAVAANVGSSASPGLPSPGCCRWWNIPKYPQVLFVILHGLHLDSKLVAHERMHIQTCFLDSKWNGVDGVPASPQTQLSPAAAPSALMLAAAHHAAEITRSIPLRICTAIYSVWRQPH